MRKIRAMRRLPIPGIYVVILAALFTAIYLVQDYSYFLFSKDKDVYDYSGFFFFSLVYITWACSTFLIYNGLARVWQILKNPVMRLLTVVVMGFVFGILVQIIANLLFHMGTELFQGRLTPVPWEDLKEHVAHGYMARTVEFWVILLFFWVFRNVRDYQSLFPGFDKLTGIFMDDPEWKKNIPVPVNSSIRKLPVEKVDWFEATGNYITVHGNGKKYLIRCTMNALLEKIDQKLFTRIHRSIVIKNDSVVEVAPAGKGKYKIELRYGIRLTSSKSYQKQVNQIKPQDSEELSFAF